MIIIVTGVNTPRSHTDDGSPLPSARLVSVFFALTREAPAENYTLALMQWGQFVDHDLTHTPISRGKRIGLSVIFISTENFVIPISSLMKIIDKLKFTDFKQLKMEGH